MLPMPLSLQINGSLYPWQYLFIIEGVIPIALGLIMPFWLTTGIDNAWYLKPEEKAFAKRRMEIDVGGEASDRKITRRDWIEAVKDWRVWSTMLGNTMASLSSQGFTIFFPLVVKVGQVHQVFYQQVTDFNHRASATTQAHMPI